ELHYSCPIAAATPRGLHSFPTRRSSDLGEGLSANLRLTAGGQVTYNHQLTLQDNDSLITINTGTLQAVLHKQGSNLIQSILKNRSEEHTSELQSRENLVCRLLLEKKKKC